MKGEAGGFYTEEIQSQGVRQGFKLITLEGQEVVLAHVKIQSPYRVGKYGVDVDCLDRVGVPAIRRAAEKGHLVVIDEIGKMESFSASFRKAVFQIIEGNNRVLGTIMLNSNPWADAIKQHPEVNLLQVNRANRQRVLEELSTWLIPGYSPE